MQDKTINGFELKRRLGVGGMAEVWYAENEIGMKAAVKILSEELSHNAQMKERFLNEAKVMVKLDHPNIRKVQGYGNIDGRPAIIMEYLDGSDLKARMKQGQHFTDEELKRWWNQIVDALNYTHAKDIVHRDIKPSNIFIDQKGNAKLLDFGIAKVADTTTGTLTGSTLGTRIYMSPEQVKDPKRVGTASDVYSLAVSFVHLLTGKAPYDSTTSSDYDIQVSIVTKPVDMGKVPEEWRGFLTPYLIKEADKRPELRHFELVNPEEKAANYTDDDTTLAEDEKQAEAKPVQKPKQKVNKGQKPEPNDKQKSKKTLWVVFSIKIIWIVVGIMVALLVFSLWPKNEPAPTDPDTQAYEACQTVSEFRAYIAHFGSDAKHYADAKQFVDKFVSDSIAQVEAKQKEAKRSNGNSEAKKHDEHAAPQKERLEASKNPAQEKKQQSQSVSGSYNGHDYVDLGLPSGTLWATCNIGASKPEEYGDYFAWGETQPKSTYNRSTYKFCNGEIEKLTKYCSDSKYGNNGFTDNMVLLQPCDDAATVNWGNGWQIPSKEQWEELKQHTKNKWTTQKGVKGYLFTAGNGGKLFLPAAGMYGSSGLDDVDSGIYSSNRVRTIGIYDIVFIFDWNSCSVANGWGYRFIGRSVRPVHIREKKMNPNVREPLHK